MSEQYDGTERRSYDVNIDTTLAVLNHRVEEMHRDFTKMSNVLEKLTDAISKLAIVEERQSVLSNSIKALADSVGKLEERISAVELDDAKASKAIEWVYRAVWAAAAFAIAIGYHKVTG